MIYLHGGHGKQSPELLKEAFTVDLNSSSSLERMKKKKKKLLDYIIWMDGLPNTDVYLSPTHTDHLLFGDFLTPSSGTQTAIRALHHQAEMKGGKEKGQESASKLQYLNLAFVKLVKKYGKNATAENTKQTQNYCHSIYVVKLRKDFSKRNIPLCSKPNNALWKKKEKKTWFAQEKNWGALWGIKLLGSRLSSPPWFQE